MGTETPRGNSQHSFNRIDTASTLDFAVTKEDVPVRTYCGRVGYTPRAPAQFGDGGAVHNTLNQRSNHLVGRTAKVLDYDAGSNSGTVEIEGMRWRATWATGQSSTAGDTVRVNAADGMNLSVEATVHTSI